MKLKCPRCHHIWDYKGKAEYVTSCSTCKTSVSLSRNNLDNPPPERKIETCSICGEGGICYCDL